MTKVRLVQLLAVSLLLATSANVASGQSALGGCGRWCGPSDSGIQCQDDLLCEQGEDGIYRCDGCDCDDAGGAGSPGISALDELSGCGNLCNWFPCKPGLTCGSRESDRGGQNRCFESSCGEEGECGSDCRFFPCRSGLSCENNDLSGWFCTGDSCGDDSGLRGCHGRCGASDEFGAQCESGLTCTSLGVPGSSIDICLGSSCAACGGLCGPSANGAKCAQEDSCVRVDDGAYRCSKTPIGYLPGGLFGGCGQWCGSSDNGILCQRSLSCDQGEDGIFRCSGSWCGNDGGEKLGGCYESCGPSDNGSQCQAGLRCEGLYDGSSYTCMGRSCAPSDVNSIGAGCGHWCGSSNDNDIGCLPSLTCNKGLDGIYRCGESCGGGLGCGFRDLGALVGSACGPDGGGRCRLGLQCAKDVDGIHKCA